MLHCRCFELNSILNLWPAELLLKHRKTLPPKSSLAVKWSSCWHCVREASTAAQEYCLPASRQAGRKRENCLHACMQAGTSYTAASLLWTAFIKAGGSSFAAAVVNAVLPACRQAALLNTSSLNAACLLAGRQSTLLWIVPAVLP